MQNPKITKPCYNTFHMNNQKRNIFIERKQSLQLEYLQILQKSEALMSVYINLSFVKATSAGMSFSILKGTCCLPLNCEDLGTLYQWPIDQESVLCQCPAGRVLPTSVTLLLLHYDLYQYFNDYYSPVLEQSCKYISSKYLNDKLNYIWSKHRLKYQP